MIVLALCLAAQTAAPPPPPARIESPLAEADALYVSRDTAGHAEQALALLQAALQLDPASYEVRWRIARVCNWLGDGAPDDMPTKKKWAELGWRTAEPAVAAVPGRVEAQFWGAATFGQYAEAAGPLAAAFGGMGGRYERWMRRAYEIDKTYEDHGAARALGKYEHLMPDFVGGSNERALRYLEESKAARPHALRTRLYLGELLADDGHKPRAIAELQACVDADASRGDRADNVRIQGRCRAALAKLR